MRAFLAIPLPFEVQRAVAAAARGVPGLRPQKPETIHLTIRFLGEIDDPEPVTAAVAPVAAATPPFSLEVRGVGAFPKPAAARVVWAGVERGAAEAAALAAGVEDALAPLGFPREGRAWHAHVTMGRFRDRPGRVRPDPDAAFGTAAAERLVLYRSTLTPSGALHEEVRELSLGRG